ncbi:MAG: hypothetical protein K9H62_23080 [Bacteroidales bacterium]|nr:hypothetical protein [Bacteroidales bacterium]
MRILKFFMLCAVVLLLACEENVELTVPSVEGNTASEFTNEFPNSSLKTIVEWEGYYIKVNNQGWPIFEIVGTYNRVFDAEAGECRKPESNCLPTIFIEGIYNGPNGSGDQSIELDEELANELNDFCAAPLTEAINSGASAVKTWYFDNGGNEVLNLPQEAEDDLYDDLVTIKIFNGHFFLVRLNATEYSDCPEYDW